MSVISEEQYQKLKVPELKPSSNSLVGPSQDKLSVCRQFTETLTYKNNTVNQVMYVVKGLRKPLIGHPTITALKLVSHVNTVHLYQQKIMNKFPKLFRG